MNNHNWFELADTPLIITEPIMAKHLRKVQLRPAGHQGNACTAKRSVHIATDCMASLYILYGLTHTDTGLRQFQYIEQNYLQI